VRGVGGREGEEEKIDAIGARMHCARQFFVRRLSRDRRESIKPVIITDRLVNSTVSRKKSWTGVIRPSAVHKLRINELPMFARS